MADVEDSESMELVAHATNMIASVAQEQFGQVIMDMSPLLDSEDRYLYETMCHNIIRELRPQSSLEYFEVIDFVFKFFEERRYKLGIAALFQTAKGRNEKSPFIPEELHETWLPKYYVESLEGLARLSDNAGRIRRALQKNLRDMVCERNKALSPPIAPEDTTSEGDD